MNKSTKDLFHAKVDAIKDAVRSLQSTVWIFADWGINIHHTPKRCKANL